MGKHSSIVAAPHHLAATLGANVLQRGGNAFDAAVAVSLAIGIVQPYHSGIGGGCNCTFMSATGEAAHINARGPAPKRLTREVFLTSDGVPDYALVKEGGLALTVPSLVAGLMSLHQGRGKLSWSEVCLAPVPLAANGFTADFMLAGVYEKPETSAKVARYARGPLAQPVQEGARVVQPQLAQTLKLIARDPQTLYKGELAKGLVAAVGQSGGCLGLDDLESYQPTLTPLNESHYRGWRILAPGLPTIGSLQTQLALNILNRLSVSDVGLCSAQHQHLIAEVVRASYLERARAQNDEAASAIIGDEVAERLAAEISPHHASEGTFEDEQASESCTSHFCVADNEGNVVSQTQTVRSHFGCGVIDAETGIVLNDSVGDFSLKPGEVTTQGIRYGGRYNLLRPGAEPASSQSPLIALHPETGDLIAAGAAGGPRIVSAAVQTLVNQIAFDMSAQVAVALPRVHSHGPLTHLEADDKVAAALRSLGHQTAVFAPSGIAQTVRRRGGSWEGGADPRGPGGVSSVTQEGVVRTYGYS